MVCQIQSEDGIGDAYVVRVRSFFFFFSSRRGHTRCLSDWNSDVCSSDLVDFCALMKRIGVDPIFLLATSSMRLLVEVGARRKIGSTPLRFIRAQKSTHSSGG